MIRKDDFNNQFLEFIEASPTPFHAVSQMSLRLEAAGFEFLDEASQWQLQPAAKYYTTRNGSSLVAFIVGSDGSEGGLRLYGAHTDSPCLKIKPSPELLRHGCIQLGLEVYGGVLLNPWFDRDLSIAGKVVYETRQGDIDSILLDYGRPVVTIPSLAIHLDKEANSKRCINKQQHLPALMALSHSQKKLDFRALLRQEIRTQMPHLPLQQILDYELSLYDTQKPALIGLDREFIASARLDNLLSCFAGLQALLTSDTETGALLVCNDHEEVGSNSMAGAQGPMLQSVLQRMLGSPEDYARAIDRSMLISADNAHAIHPNYADKHDGNHGPVLNRGPVIKVNANQRYATNSETASLFRQLCQLEKVPVQSFVVRTDLGCGSTIGPITAAGIGVKTLDVGVPQLAMHSIRELAGCDDAHYLYRIATRFFNLKQLFQRPV
jgi:aspartyl aminopeptidase